MINGKIHTMDELALVAEAFRKDGKKIVLCHGTFDLVHMGHIRHLQRARQEGDVLLVTLTAGTFVNKGPGRPVFSDELRAENLAALVMVDGVAVCHEPTALHAIQQIKPDVYVKGKDYKNASDDITGNIQREIDAVNQCGGRIFYTDEITFSSSSLLNEHLGVFTDETKHYLRDFREKYDIKDIIANFETLKNLKVLVVGDAIVDQYCYTKPLGQSGKSNVLSVAYDNDELFAGGSVAVANNIAGFTNNVTLLSGLGSQDNYEDFLRKNLHPAVKPAFFYFPDAPTVLKRRYVDPDMAKLFEIYYFKPDPFLGDEENTIVQWVHEHVPQYDVVVVADFGNGFISPKTITAICETAKFMIVNTQLNSGNRGYHVITRYPRCDAVSLNEPEVRLAAHNRHDSISKVAEKVGEKLGAKYLAITRGSKGAMILDREGGHCFNIPALSTKVVDRIGAGDAFLSLWGLCLGAGFNPEIAGFIASVAGAISVQIVCNRDPIQPITLYKYMTTLMK